MKAARLILVALLLSPLSLHAALQNALPQPYPAPDIASHGPWLNTDNKDLTAADIKGKVVLIDFWTYSCINCLRTIPYLRAWHETYKGDGFMIIGIHAPEFDFEKMTSNVEKAMKRFKVSWPVVQDNEHILWKRFSNQYWPAHYLIDRNGMVVYTHFGEGKYDVTENNIRELINAKAGAPTAKLSEAPSGAAYHQSLETYLGTDRSERFQSQECGKPEGCIYAFPPGLTSDYWALNGQWKRERQYVESKAANVSLRLRFRGGKVFLVLATADGKPGKARITFNGKALDTLAGKDVANGVVEITEQRLYELLDRKIQPTDSSDGVIEIEALSPGIRAYAFTFGA